MRDDDSSELRGRERSSETAPGRPPIVIHVLLGTGFLLFLALVGMIVYLSVSPSARSVPQTLPAASPGTSFQPVVPRGQAPGGGATEGRPAPAFEAPSLRGGAVTLADFKGRGVVMNFFASWCAPCRAEARDLEATYQKYRSRGVVFLGVDLEQDTQEDAVGFLKEFGITYPAIRDEDGEIAQKYRLFGLPTTYFIDPNGVLRSRFVGPFLGSEGLKELERRIEMILPE